MASRLSRGAPKSFGGNRNSGPYLPKQGFIGVLETGGEKDVRELDDGTIKVRVRLMSNAFAVKGAKFAEGEVVDVHITDKDRCKAIKDIVLKDDRRAANTEAGMVMEFEGGVVKGDLIEAKFMRTFGKEDKVTDTETDRTMLDDQKVSLGYIDDDNTQDHYSYYIYQHKSAVALNGDDSLPKMSVEDMAASLGQVAEVEIDAEMKDRLSALATEAEGYDGTTGLKQLEIAAEALRCQETLDCPVNGPRFGLLLRAYPLEPFLEEGSEQEKEFLALDAAGQEAFKKKQAVSDTWNIHLSKAVVKVEIDDAGNTEYVQANFREMVENEFNIAIQSAVRKSTGNKQYVIDDSMRVTYEMLEQADFDIEAHLAQIDGLVSVNEKTGEPTYGNRNLTHLVMVMSHLKEAKIDEEPSLVFEVMAVRQNATVGKSASAKDNKKVIEQMRPIFDRGVDQNGKPRNTRPANNIIHDVILHEQRFFDKSLRDFRKDHRVSKIRLKDVRFDNESKTNFAGGKFHFTSDLVSNVSEALGLKDVQEKIAKDRADAFNPYEVRKKAANGQEQGQEQDKAPETNQSDQTDDNTQDNDNTPPF